MSSGVNELFKKIEYMEMMNKDNFIWYLKINFTNGETSSIAFDGINKTLILERVEFEDLTEELNTAIKAQLKELREGKNE